MSQNMPGIGALKQMLAYVEWAEEEGSYYGNRDNFDKRHKLLKTWLQNVIGEFERRTAERKAKQ